MSIQVLAKTPYFYPRLFIKENERGIGDQQNQKVSMPKVKSTNDQMIH